MPVSKFILKLKTLKWWDKMYKQNLFTQSTDANNRHHYRAGGDMSEPKSYRVAFILCAVSAALTMILIALLGA